MAKQAMDQAKQQGFITPVQVEPPQLDHPRPTIQAAEDAYAQMWERVTEDAAMPIPKAERKTRQRSARLPVQQSIKSIMAVILGGVSLSSHTPGL